MPRPKLKRLLKRQTNLRWEDLSIHDTMALIGGHWGRLETEREFFRLKNIEDAEAFYLANEDTMPERFGGLLPGTRPWCWWSWSAPEPRDKSLPEVEQLDRLGLLTDAELAAIRADIHTRGILNEYHELPFRRSWGWWRFTSPRPYDWSGVPELIQLERMREVLTDRERYILENLEDIRECRKSGATGKDTLKYLGFSDDERTYLGLPQLD